jgi:hypothetical protein
MSNPHTRYPEDPNPAESKTLITKEETRQSAEGFGCFLFLCLLLICSTVLACVWIIWGGG